MEKLRFIALTSVPDEWEKRAFYAIYLGGDTVDCYITSSSGIPKQVGNAAMITNIFNTLIGTGGIVVVNDNNTNPDRHLIATVDGKQVYETVVSLQDFTLDNNTLSLTLNNEDGDEQTVSVDLTELGTNLGYTPSPTNGVVTNTAGDDATIPLADETNAGLLSPQEKEEVASAIQPGDNISELNNDSGFISSVDWDEIGGDQFNIDLEGFSNDGADPYINQSDLEPVATSGNHSDLTLDDGTNPHNATQDDIPDGTTYKQYSQTEKDKLAGIEENANNYIHPNHSGDVTSVGDGATTISNDAVSNAKLSNVPTSTIKGRIDSGTGDPQDLTASQVRTIINVEDGAQVNTVTSVNGQQGTVVLDNNDVGLGDVPNLDTTDAVNNEHVQNTDTILDEGGTNEITAATIKTHVESTANPHETDLQKAYNQTALSEDILEKVIGVDDEGNVIEQGVSSATVLSQHTESQTTGDTGTNLFQPDFGAAVFTSSDMQDGSSYSGEIYLEIDNNEGGTFKIIELFGIELFNAKSAIPEIKGRLTFDIDFYNQAGDIITYQISYGFTSAGLQFYGSEESTIDNTVSADIEFTVNSGAGDNIRVNKAKIQRC